MNLAFRFPLIFWNTACLIVDSGSLEDNSTEELVDIYEPEADDLINGVTFEDLPDRSGKIRKTASTDYNKLGKAISDMQYSGIEISTVNINKSGFSFEPDVEHNRILYGLKGLNRVSDALVEQIIANRPYKSLQDFYYKVKPQKQAMVSLIKGGAFDDFEPKERAMVEFIWMTCDKKKLLNLRNLQGLMRYDLIPNESEELITAKRIFEFNRYLKDHCSSKIYPQLYKLNERALNFLAEMDYTQELVKSADDQYFMSIAAWNNKYDKYKAIFKTYITQHHDELLKNFNIKVFMEDWKKYGSNNISAWEMESLCFYYHEHELKNVDTNKFGITSFKSLNEQPEVAFIMHKGKAQIPIYKIHKIMGTVIAKNKLKSTAYILTTDSGVVPVKFNKEYFSMFDKRISQYGADGVKHIMESSWFNRGNKLIISGIRRENEFVAKKYQATPWHTLYHIDEVQGSDIVIRHERYKGETEEDEEE